MNSKQRRQDSRQWKYNIRLSEGKSLENGYDNMFDWCCDTWGNGVRCAGWREKHYWSAGTWWQFNDDKKAVLFALRWQ
jgi:hypothetical protein